MLDAHALPGLLPFAGRAAASTGETSDARRPGGALFLEEHGRGEPVVFLHGLCGSSRYWRRLVPEVGPGHRALCVDLLGFGRSPWPECDYGPDCHVDAIERAVLGRVGSASFSVVGHSTGADLALELAARHAHRVRSVCLLALPYFDSVEHATAGLCRGTWARFVVTAPRTARAVCETVCATMQRIGPAVLPRVPLHLPHEVVVDGFLHSFTSVSRTLQKVLLEHRVDQAAARLEEHGVPVTLFHDERDRVAPFSGSVAYRARYRNARLHVVQGQGHLLGVSSGRDLGPLLRDALFGVRP